jgi:hypothetical protein
MQRTTPAPTPRTRRRWLLPRAGALTLLAAAGCGRAGPGVPTPAAWLFVPEDATVYYDNAGGIQDSLRLVVRDAATLHDVWAQATSQQASPPPPPEVGFAKEMLLVAAAGRMTPEDQIRVDSVVVQRRTLATGKQEEVLSAVVRTIEGCGRFATPAFPVQIVRIRRFDGPVVFVERRERAGNCQGTD